MYWDWPIVYWDILRLTNSLLGYHWQSNGGLMSLPQVRSAARCWSGGGGRGGGSGTDPRVQLPPGAQVTTRGPQVALPTSMLYCLWWHHMTSDYIILDVHAHVDTGSESAECECDCGSIWQEVQTNTPGRPNPRRYFWWRIAVQQPQGGEKTSYLQKTIFEVLL